LYDARVSRRKSIDPKLAFGKTIRKFRLEKGLSQERLAELANIHRTYIGDVERGTRNVSVVNMARIAQALGFPLSRIIAAMEEDD
jgi:transcriptional regulator with XRE-family HTH domain